MLAASTCLLCCTVQALTHSLSLSEAEGGLNVQRGTQLATKQARRGGTWARGSTEASAAHSSKRSERIGERESGGWTGAGEKDDVERACGYISVFVHNSSRHILALLLPLLASLVGSKQ